MPAPRASKPPEPPSLVQLRRQVNAMLPRVDLPEVILEVMVGEPRFVEAFTAASGGRTRLGDLQVSIAACLTAHALNIGYSPIVKKGGPVGCQVGQSLPHRAQGHERT